MIYSYLNIIGTSKEEMSLLNGYMKMIVNRIKGKELTTSSWMRKYVMDHHSYQHDSLINDEINYDIIKKVIDITDGRESCCKISPEFIQQQIPWKIEKPTINYELRSLSQDQSWFDLSNYVSINQNMNYNRSLSDPYAA